MSHTETLLRRFSEAAPIAEAVLVLKGEGRGPINNLCVPSAVSPFYAPSGWGLISVTVLGIETGDDAALEQKVKEQLADWFGPGVERWRHLRTYRIPRALPRWLPGREAGSLPRGDDSIHRCGDHMVNPSIHGALVSGRRTAERIGVRSLRDASK